MHLYRKRGSRIQVQNFVNVVCAVHTSHTHVHDGHARRKEFKALEITAVAPNTSIKFGQLDAGNDITSTGSYVSVGR